MNTPFNVTHHHVQVKIVVLQLTPYVKSTSPKIYQMFIETP